MNDIGYYRIPRILNSLIAISKYLSFYCITECCKVRIALPRQGHVKEETFTQQQQQRRGGVEFWLTAATGNMKQYQLDNSTLHSSRSRDLLRLEPIDRGFYLNSHGTTLKLAILRLEFCYCSALITKLPD